MDTKHRYLQEGRAAARRGHFAAGRTLAMWRGAAHTFKDKKKVTSQQACRSRCAKEES